MYYYTFSSGDYSDYSFVIIMHKTKFSRQKFIEMYNEAVGSGSDDFHYENSVAEVMCDRYGFVILENEIEINCGYGCFKPIKDQKDINGEHLIIDVDKDF